MGQFINSVLVGLFNGGAVGGESVRRNAGNTAWEAFTPGGGATDLDGLTDVAIDTPQRGDILVRSVTGEWQNFTAGLNNRVLTSHGAGADLTWEVPNIGVIDHGGLTGLSDDDHSIYALLAGRSGGQIIVGGTLASQNLTLQSTAHATRGKILFGTSAYDEVNNRLGIGTAAPVGGRLDVAGGARISGAWANVGDSIPVLGLGAGTITAITGGVSYNSLTIDASQHIFLISAAEAMRILPTGQLELKQLSSFPAPGTNSAQIYAKDTAGTAEIFVKDEAGTETQISAHAMDGPVDMYDLADSPPHVVKEANYYIGGVRYLNLSRACMLLEELLKAIRSGMTLPQIRTAIQAKPVGAIDIYRTESFAQHNTRMGTSLVKLNWDTVQNQLQAKYDAERAGEVAAHDAWEQMPVETRGNEPIVRPVANIRKAKPAWLAARGG